MERQKIITFKKKVYQKIFIYQGDMLFSRAKKTGYFPQIPGNFQWKINENWKLRRSIFIGFPLICLRILREIPDFFALENKISPRQINLF